MHPVKTVAGPFSSWFAGGFLRYLKVWLNSVFTFSGPHLDRADPGLSPTFLASGVLGLGTACAGWTVAFLPNAMATSNSQCIVATTAATVEGVFPRT